MLLAEISVDRTEHCFCWIGRFSEEEDTACVCSLAFPLLLHHLMGKKMKRSSLSSEMTPHHSQSHYHPHLHRLPLLLPRCSALPLALMEKGTAQTQGVFWNMQSVCVCTKTGVSHPPTASSGSAGETRRPQDCLVQRWELERGEKRLTTAAADLMTDRLTADGCRIHTHLTQFAGQLKVFVHHSSEKLKPHFFISISFN